MVNEPTPTELGPAAIEYVPVPESGNKMRLRPVCLRVFAQLRETTDSMAPLGTLRTPHLPAAEVFGRTSLPRPCLVCRRTHPWSEMCLDYGGSSSHPTISVNR